VFSCNVLVDELRLAPAKEPCTEDAVMVEAFEGTGGLSDSDRLPIRGARETPQNRVNREWGYATLTYSGGPKAEFSEVGVRCVALVGAYISKDCTSLRRGRAGSCIGASWTSIVPLSRSTTHAYHKNKRRSNMNMLIVGVVGETR